MIRGVATTVIVGLVVLLFAVVVGFTAVLTNAGGAHVLTENFALFGHPVAGSTGTAHVADPRSTRSARSRGPGHHRNEGVRNEYR
jgi:hypothetical protein